VWSFLAEPYHLSDWFPGILGVEPDRRGFAPGARWKVRVRSHTILLGSRVGETMVVVRAVEPFERWVWHLVSENLDVELRLHAEAADRTVVTCTTSGRRRRLPDVALQRLYDLVQTAASI
jgi:hypothetical protein